MRFPRKPLVYNVEDILLTPLLKFSHTSLEFQGLLPFYPLAFSIDILNREVTDFFWKSSYRYRNVQVLEDKKDR